MLASKGKEDRCLVYKLVSLQQIYEKKRLKEQKERKDPRQVTKEISVSTRIDTHHFKVKVTQMKDFLTSLYITYEWLSWEQMCQGFPTIGWRSWQKRWRSSRKCWKRLRRIRKDLGWRWWKRTWRKINYSALLGQQLLLYSQDAIQKWYIQCMWKIFLFFFFRMIIIQLVSVVLSHADFSLLGFLKFK